MSLLKYFSTILKRSIVTDIIKDLIKNEWFQVDSCSTFSKICKQYPTIEDMKGMQTKRRIPLLQFCLVILMHLIKNDTVGTLVQDRVQNESLLLEFCSTILAILINNITLENSHKDHIENE